MAQLNHTVNPEDTKPTYEAVPAGEYLVVIEASSYEENSKGTGMKLALTYQILDGPFKGKKITESLNLKHINAQTEAIAKQCLNSIGVAVGVSQIQDSAQLHNIPLYINVKVKDSEEYGKQNAIRGYKSAKGTTAAPAAVPAAVNPGEQATAQSAPAKKPWER